MKLSILKRPIWRALVLTAAVPLSACNGLGIPGFPEIGPGGVPAPVPAAYVPAPSPISGLSLADAYHDAIRCLDDQQGGALRLVSAQSLAVTQDGLSPAGWTLVFQRPSRRWLMPMGVPVESPPASQGGLCVGPPVWSTPSATLDYAPIDGSTPNATTDTVPPLMFPVPLLEQEISLTVDGQGNVMVPVEVPWQGEGTIAFSKVIAVKAILATAAQLGSPPGPYGYSVSLGTEAGSDPVFAISPVPPSDYRGMYRFDAYSGALLSLPGELP